MRKLFLLVLCTLPFLGIGNAIADSNQPPIKVILTDVPNEQVKLTRDILVEPLQCYYLSGTLFFMSCHDIGDVDIRVENLLTNEVYSGEFSSSQNQQYTLCLGEDTGNYEITCTTSTGYLCIGTLCII